MWTAFARVLDVFRRSFRNPPSLWDAFDLGLAPLHVDANGLLVGAGVEHIIMHKSWHYAGLATKDGNPDAIVAHYTATMPGSGRGMAIRRQTPWSEFAKAHRAAYPGKTVPQTSWHATIETDGLIIQQAPFTVGCWHALGELRKLGPANRVAVGIEHVGYGKEWPDEQLRSSCRLVRAIVTRYRIDRANALVAHSEINPKDRSDPGKLFMATHAPKILDYAYAHEGPR